MSERKLRTVQQFVERHPEFTYGGVRWWIFNASQNGLAKFGAVVRIGGRVYLEDDRVFDWIDSQQPNRAA